MLVDILLTRLIPFSLGFFMAAAITQIANPVATYTQKPTDRTLQSRSVESYCVAIGETHAERKERELLPKGNVNGLKILSKPRPTYTDEARQHSIQGSTTLRVEFLANRKIGSVEPIRPLSHGLTEQAISAARRISFHPRTIRGRSVTVKRIVEYTFTIY